MVLLKLYYLFSSLYYKTKFNHLGKRTEFRFGSTVLNGDYVSVGDDVHAGSGFVLAVYPEFGGVDNPVKSRKGLGVVIKDRVFFNRNCTIYCADNVEIGEDVLFGSGILITDNNHGMDASCELSYMEQPLSTRKVVVGDGSWIGERAIILSGSIIGKRCIIAANSVVTGGVYPDNSMLAGSPAKIIRTWSDVEKKWVRGNHL